VDNRRVYAAVAAVAIVVHLGALWHRFAIDDHPIIYWNELVHSLDGIWRSFGMPYWPADLGGRMYRPLVLATYSIDWQLGGAGWFHAVNLAWHAGASVIVAMLARRWLSVMGALAAGLLFAVHPVHVEAIASVVGRSELMAAAFACLAVYAALIRRSVVWSAVAFAAGLLTKENAAVVPGLIALGWLLGFDAPPPARRRMIAYAASWVIVGGLYAAARWAVLHPFSQYSNAGPIFIEQGELAVRLTGVYALSDVLRLLVFPLTLRVDYSPAERSIVLSPLDPRFLLGLACFALWALLFVWAWRRGRRVEAFGLGWTGVALLPVANLLFPIGVLVAERALYLPSVGVVLAAGALFQRLEPRGGRYWGLLILLVVAGGLRSALRVPVWRSDTTVTLSILEDAPRSFVGPFWTGALLLSSRQPEKALAAYQQSIAIFDRASTVYFGAAAAAFAARRPDLAQQYLERADRYCRGCAGLYRSEAQRALARGDSATADSLFARARRIDTPPP